MPEFRVVYVSDGRFIADCIARKYSQDKHKLAVELHELRNDAPVVAVGSASISVLVTSPAMLQYLHKMIRTNEDRTWLINLMKADEHSVTLSCQVDERVMENTINVFFNNNELTWQHLDVGTNTESFHQSLIKLMNWPCWRPVR